jgi:hypothetical protein
MICIGLSPCKQMAAFSTKGLSSMTCPSKAGLAGIGETNLYFRANGKR